MCVIAVGATAPQQQAPDRGRYRTPTASARSQWAHPNRKCQIAVGITRHQLPDPNSKCQIAVGPTGPQQQVPDRMSSAGRQPQVPDCNGHYQTSTASARSQWALPNLNSKRQIAVGTTGLQQRALDRSEPYRASQTGADRSGHLRTQVAVQGGGCST